MNIFLQPEKASLSEIWWCLTAINFVFRLYVVWMLVLLLLLYLKKVSGWIIMKYKFLAFEQNLLRENFKLKINRGGYKLMDILVTLLATAFCKAGNWIIFIVAVINIFVFFITRNAIKNADEMSHPRNDKATGVSASMDWSKEEISKMKDERKKVVGLYTWYANLTAIFPLLGIIGTVAALVTYSDMTMMDNLMIALSTTLFGTFFAIVFKSMDAVLSGPMDLTIENADFVIHEYERKGIKE